MKWEEIKLDNVLQFARNGASIKQADGKGGIPITRIETISNGYVDENKFGYADIETNVYEDYYLKKGDILMSHINSWKHLGKTALVQKEYDVIHGMNLLMLRTKQDVLIPSFANYYFSTNSFKEQLYRISNQSVNQSSFSVTKLRELLIPLPPLHIQQQISVTLDKADALRRKDQDLLNKYDELAQAIFYDMFGDPVKNVKGWDVKNMSEICSKVTDGTHDTPERLSEGVPFITGKHIRPGVIDYSNCDYVNETVHEEIYKRCNPELGDVLYTNIGVNYGTAAINTVTYPFSMKNVALLKVKKNIILGEYLQFLLNNSGYKKRLLSESGVGGAQQFLSLKQIRNLKIVVPDLKLQQNFASVINELTFIRSKVSIKETMYLFENISKISFD